MLTREENFLRLGNDTMEFLAVFGWRYSINLWYKRSCQTRARRARYVSVPFWIWPLPCIKFEYMNCLNGWRSETIFSIRVLTQEFKWQSYLYMYVLSIWEKHSESLLVGEISRKNRKILSIFQQNIHVRHCCSKKQNIVRIWHFQVIKQINFLRFLQSNFSLIKITY